MAEFDYDDEMNSSKSEKNALGDGAPQAAASAQRPTLLGQRRAAEREIASFSGFIFCEPGQESD